MNWRATKKPVEKLTPRDALQSASTGVNSSTGSLNRVGRKCRGAVCRQATDAVDIIYYSPPIAKSSTRKRLGLSRCAKLEKKW
jgi:hypothetical protein